MAQNGLTLQNLLTAEQLNDHGRLFGKVTIAPGHTLASHEHHGETETYYILSSNGIYDDDGKKIPANPGDCFFCADGHSHGITCAGDEPLEFIALILNT